MVYVLKKNKSLNKSKFKIVTRLEYQKKKIKIKI